MPRIWSGSLRAPPCDNASVAPGSATAPDLAEELARILRDHPELPRLLQPQPGEPEQLDARLLCPAPTPLFVVPVPVPGRTGSLWVSRLPGARAPERDVAALADFGITRVVCLVPPDGLAALHGAPGYLGAARRAFGERLHVLPIEDHQVPDDDIGFETTLAEVDRALADGEQVLAHCVGGCGRSGMFGACLLVRAGLEPIEAIREFRRRRRCGPETAEQLAFVLRYARRLAAIPRSPRPIARLSVSEGPPLARGGLADVRIGRAHFVGGGSRRVAVKRFRYPMSDAQADATRRCIDDLRAAGVALPTMALWRLPDGAWAQLTPLFGSRRRGSKLSQPSQFYRALSSEVIESVVDQLTRVANAGYHASIDIFVVLDGGQGGVVPIDLDLIQPLPDAAAAARQLLKVLVQVGRSAAERDRLLDVARASAERGLAHALDSELGPGSAFLRLWQLE